MNGLPGRQGGFLLLETIVAFAIALFALDALYGGGLYGLTAAHAAARTDEALIRGRSLLSEAADQGDIRPGVWDGDQPGGYHWHLTIRELSSVSLRRGQRTQQVALYDIQLTLSWHGPARARQVSLATRRTVMVAP